MTFLVSSGSYSDYSVWCTVDTQELGEQICARMDPRGGWWRVEECPHVTGLDEVRMAARYVASARAQWVDGKFRGAYGRPLDDIFVHVDTNISFDGSEPLVSSIGVTIDDTYWKDPRFMNVPTVSVTAAADSEALARKQVADALGQFMAEHLEHTQEEP